MSKSISDELLDVLIDFDTWCLCGSDECQLAQNFKVAQKAILNLIGRERVLAKSSLENWSKEQEKWANDYWLPDKAEQKGYKCAMKHLRFHLNDRNEQI